ncbi:nitroreductase family protein [Alistipes onderdonkii]|nr:nitroreductase family protein [Alistipes onderdonkii]
MNRSKILFFCAGAVLAALLVWWLSAGERPPARESGKLSPLDVIMTRTSVRAYRDCPVGADTVELLLRAAMAAPSAVNRQPWAFVVVDDRELLRELSGALPFAKMAAHAPLAVVVCGDLSRNPGASGDWWVMDASAASENLLLAAHALGLGAVWTGVYPRDERVEAVRRVLGLPADVVPLNLIPVGYPADNLAPKQKWNPANVRYNGWAE